CPRSARFGARCTASSRPRRAAPTSRTPRSRPTPPTGEPEPRAAVGACCRRRLPTEIVAKLGDQLLRASALDREGRREGEAVVGLGAELRASRDPAQRDSFRLVLD